MLLLSSNVCNPLFHLSLILTSVKSFRFCLIKFVLNLMPLSLTLDNVSFYLSFEENILALISYLRMDLLGVLSLVPDKYCLLAFLTTFDGILLNNVVSNRRCYK